jgi:hypothetical protein
VSTVRIGLYGLLLGLSGKPEHAALLRDIVVDEKKRPITGIDGIMGGLCVLDPEDGPKFVLDVLTNPKNDFNFRYSALRTTRFVLTELPRVDKEKIFERMRSAIRIPDISDLVIDDLRKNQCWAPLDEILALYGKDKFDLQVIRRSIIRYALRCPGAAAAAFIADLRSKDAQLVSDVEEILRFEDAQLKAQAATAAPAK